MSSKFQIHQFELTIYPRKLWVVKGGSFKDIERAFYIEQSEEVEDMLESCKAITFRASIKDGDWLGVVVYIKQKMVIKDIAHEALHVSSVIFSDIGVKGDFYNDEAQAYLVGFAADCINQVVVGRYK